MPLAPLPVPDDFTGATDDIKIAAAVAVSPVLAFDRSYSVSNTIVPAIVGQQFIGAGPFSTVVSITKTTAGHLFDLSGTTGVQIHGLQIFGSLNGYGINLNNTDKAIIEGCRIHGFLTGGVGGSGVTMYTKVINNVIAGPVTGVGSGVEFDIGTTSARVWNNDIAGYGTLVRTWCDGISIIGNIFEAANPAGQGVRIESGSCDIVGNWFDPSSISAGTIAQINASASINGEGNRGVTPSNVIIHNPSTWALTYQP